MMTLKLADTITDSSAGITNDLEQLASADWLSLEETMNYQIGVDVSRHQGKMDWQKCAAQGVKFVAIRVTIGDYYTDPRFEENWQGAKNAGLMVTAYHVVTPEISVGSQMSRLRDVLNDEHWFDLPLVLDCELTRGMDNDIITARIEGCTKAIISWGMERPIIYTNAGFWNSRVISLSYWRKFPLWVANYTNALAPTLPHDWDKWAIWQYTSKGDGHKYGAESKSIDINRMIATIAPPPEPEPDPELPEMIRTNTPGDRLNVRTAPVVKAATRIGSVRNGTVFRTVGKNGKWYEVVAYVHGDHVTELK